MVEYYPILQQLTLLLFSILTLNISSSTVSLVSVCLFPWSAESSTSVVLLMISKSCDDLLPEKILKHT